MTNQSGFFDDARKDARGLRWFAHRGGAAESPENTLPAFEHALTLGYQYLELDAQLTADQQWVVLHDDTLERTTEGRGNVANASASQVFGLDAGYHFDDSRAGSHRGQNYRIPLLADVLRLSDTACFNVEIKPNDVNLARHGAKFLCRSFWNLAKDLGIESRLLIAGQSQEIADCIRGVSQHGVATAASRNEALKFWLASKAGRTAGLSRAFQALQIPPKYRHLSVATDRLIDAAHRHGIEVHLWTLNDDVVVEQFATSGVDGIMTDHPSRYRPRIRPGT